MLENSYNGKTSINKQAYRAIQVKVTQSKIAHVWNNSHRKSEYCRCDNS